MDLREVGLGRGVWIFLPQDRNQFWDLVNIVMYLRVPLTTGNFLIG
jgi:hypothetical protein